MAMRGRNGKWLGTGNGGTVGKGWVIVLFEFCPRVEECRRGVTTFVVINIIELCAHVSQHECVWSKDRSRSGRGPVNGKKGADCGELAVDFFLFNIEKASNMLNYLFIGESHLFAGRTVRRQGGDDIRGVASTVGGRRQARRNEDGGEGARHGK